MATNYNPDNYTFAATNIPSVPLSSQTTGGNTTTSTTQNIISPVSTLIAKNTTQSTKPVESFLQTGDSMKANDVATSVTSDTMQFPTPEVPQTKTSGATGTVNNFLTTQEQIQKSQEQKNLEQEQRSLVDRIKGLIDKPLDSAGLQKSEFDANLKKFGVSLDEYNTLGRDTARLQGELDALGVAEQNDILSLEGQGKGVPLNIINRKQNQIQREYAIKRSGYAAELNAKTALMNVISGNIAMSRSLANDAVNAAIADREAQYKDLERWFNINESIIGKLDKGFQDDLNRQREAEKQALEDARVEKQNIMNLILQNPSAAVSAGLVGELQTLTLDEAVQRITPFTAQQTPAGELRSISGVGLVRVKDDNTYDVVVPESGAGVVASQGFSDFQTETDFRADAVSLLQQLPPQPTGEQLQGAFSTLRTLYSPNSVTDDAILSVLGIQPVGAEELPGEVSQSEEDILTVADVGKGVFGLLDSIGRGILGFATGEKDVSPKGTKNNTK